MRPPVRGTGGRTARLEGALGLALVACAAPLAGQGAGTASFTGVVLDDVTGGALHGAAVVLSTLGLRVTTDDQGRFLFENLPAGLVNARFEAPGYVAVVEEVELADASDFVQVWLERVDAVLDEILVLAGQRPPSAARSDGVVTNNPDRDRRSVLDLLANQVPGVLVQRQGGISSPASIRIRGAGSFQVDLAPEIYLDGVRLDTQSAGDAQRAMSTLDMISAEEVARVRVLKGAAGSALGGSANGAIIIETKRGGSN